MRSKPIRPKLIAGTYGDVLDDFRNNVRLSASEMDEIIFNHGFSQESLEETHRLFKTLWNYQIQSSTQKTNENSVYSDKTKGEPK